LHVYNEGLAHIFSEAQRSHSVLSVSWRPRKTGDRVHSKSRG